MKLEKMYTYVFQNEGALTLGFQQIFPTGENIIRTEGYFITKEDLEKIVCDAFYMGRERTGLDEFEYDCPEDYWQKRLKEIEGE